VTPDELDKIGSESALVALCVGPDEPPWDRSEDVATTALRWLAEHSYQPCMDYPSAAVGWVARAGFYIGAPGYPEVQVESFYGWSPWLALLKLVAAVQLHKRGELEL